MSSHTVSRTIFLGVVLSLCAIVAGTYLYSSKWGRAVRGISTVVVANDSEEELRNVRVSLSASGIGPINRTFDVIRPAERRAIRVRTPDLVVDRLDFATETAEQTYTEGGIACPGEEFILSIKAPGKVTGGYGS